MNDERAKLGLWDYVWKDDPNPVRRSEIVWILLAGLAAIVAIVFSLS